MIYSTVEGFHKKGQFYSILKKLLVVQNLFPIVEEEES